MVASPTISKKVWRRPEELPQQRLSLAPRLLKDGLVRTPLGEIATIDMAPKRGVKKVKLLR
jgi:hypothetical protein